MSDGTTKGEKALKKVLDRLESHGFLIRKEVKKTVFKKDGHAERVGIEYDKVLYPEQPSTLSVYSFHSDLMLILKARIFTLRQIAIGKV